jgi:hypothetical protein
MAGQYRFKDINGNVVAQISSSADGTISFSGSAVDFSNASTITLGQVQLAGTASNALLLDGFDSTAFVFTSSFNTISQSISSQLNTLQTTSGSNIERLNNLESKSSSVDISISSINTVTESVLSRTSNLESKSSSVDISISNINSFTASNGNTSLNNLTGSLATTGSNTFFGTQTYSGSVYIANDLIVQGSSSIQYISASSVSIGTNIVQLNTANPSVRFAGLTIIDSGSVGGSGSFLYDSVHDEFVFVHRGNGTNVTSSHFVLGPETYDNLGNEIYLTTNIIPKGTGKEHLIDSCIFDNGTTTCIKNNLVTTGTACFASTLMINGNVGIGSTASTTYGTLNIVQQSVCSPSFVRGIELVHPNGTGVTGGYIGISMTGQKQGTIQVGDDGACGNLLLQSQGGNVGIGTCNPQQRLSIANAFSSLNVLYPIVISQVGNAEVGGIYSTADSITDPIGAGLAFKTYQQNVGLFEKVRITNAGNVGIGTSSPGYRLEICGDGNGTGELAVKGTGTDIGLALNNTGTGGKAWRILSTGGGSGAGNGKLITWDGTGYGWVMDCSRNMGIGTTTVDSYPNYTTLQVGCTNGIIQTYDGTVKTAIVSNSQGAGLMGTRTNHDLRIVSSDTERIRIMSTGIACFACQVCAPSGVKFGNGASTLNYYEEGGWYPQMYWSAGGIYNMSGINCGKYTKVGNMVNLQFQIQWGSYNGGASGGTLRIGPVPFANNSASRAAGSITAISPNSMALNSGYTWLGMTIDPGANFIYLIENASAGGYSHVPQVGASGIVYSLSITYMV